MNRILCSTGAFIGRPNGRNYKLLTDGAKRLDCDGFEFMMYDDWYDKIGEIKEFIASLKKPFPTFHVAKSVGEAISRAERGDTESALENFEKNCDLAQKIGAEKLVLHLWNGVNSDRNFSHNIEVYPLLRKIADGYDLTLTVENVVCGTLDPMTRLSELIAAYPDIYFTFDTKMAQFHRQLELLYAEENRSVFRHVAHIHVNDYRGGLMDWENLKTLHIGQGQIDFARFFHFVKEMNYGGDFTIEATSLDKDGVIDFDKINKSIYALRSYIEQPNT